MIADEWLALGLTWLVWLVSLASLTWHSGLALLVSLAWLVWLVSLTLIWIFGSAKGEGKS